MADIIKDFIEGINLFDVFFFVILTYNVIQCFLKGFSLSLISFMKWVLSTVVTIILVPKLQPIVSDYIQSEFINSLGLGIAIFIITLFVIILIWKTLSKAVTWTGVGPIDKVFGFLFGFLRVTSSLYAYFLFLIGFILTKIGVYQQRMLFHLI